VSGRGGAMLRAIAIAATLALGAAARAEEPVALAWKWPKGETLRYRVTRETKHRGQTAGKPDSESTLRTVAVFALLVKGATPAGDLGLVELARESIVMTDARGAVLFDSARPDAPGTAPGARALAAASGEPLTFEVSAAGRVGRIDDAAKIAATAR